MRLMEGLERLTASDWRQFSVDHAHAAAFLSNRVLKREADALRVERAQGTPAAERIDPTLPGRKVWVEKRLNELAAVGF